MRISDWSSDVCSSDLYLHLFAHQDRVVYPGFGQHPGQLRMEAIAKIAQFLHRAEHGDPPRRGRLAQDRKSVVSGKRVSVRVDLGGSRLIKKNICRDTTRTR